MVQTRSAAKREHDLRRQAIINEATQDSAADGSGSGGSNNTPPNNLKRTMAMAMIDSFGSSSSSSSCTTANLDSPMSMSSFVTPIPSPVNGPPRTPPPIPRRFYHHNHHFNNQNGFNGANGNGKTHRTLYSEEISPRMVASFPCNVLEPKLRSQQLQFQSQSQYQQRSAHFDGDFPSQSQLFQVERSPRGVARPSGLGSPFMTPKASSSSSPSSPPPFSSYPSAPSPMTGIHSEPTLFPSSESSQTQNALSFPPLLRPNDTLPLDIAFGQQVHHLPRRRVRSNSTSTSTSTLAPFGNPIPRYGGSLDEAAFLQFR